ncbi:hypothetical protein E2C01_069663 [Portunus trituberculatus]|uniref:Uncharacterized protein n=1 Tax=Portunus trituberculatus TaxID=210409 RepID=A0A5B7I2X7_PORTR|nr:hypothetical protein [Portunus trituberculatus]
MPDTLPGGGRGGRSEEHHWRDPKPVGDGLMELEQIAYLLLHCLSIFFSLCSLSTLSLAIHPACLALIGSIRSSTSLLAAELLIALPSSNPDVEVAGILDVTNALVYQELERGKHCPCLSNFFSLIMSCGGSSGSRGGSS